MSELEIFDLYQSNSDKAEDFMSQVDSTLRVQTDYEKMSQSGEWINLMELTVPYIDNIFHNPNRFIVNQEEIVKIELARKITVDTIKHLSKHTNFIQEVDKKTGDVRPGKILNIYKEESYDTYENRVIYTLIQNMKFYISKRKKELDLTQSKVDSKDDKHFEYNAKSKLSNEEIDVSVKLNTKVTDDKQEDTSATTLADRIAILERKINDLSTSDVYKVIDKLRISLIKPPIKKTNVVLKNVNFQYAMKLWDFLQAENEDEMESINEQNDYMDDGELKRLIDETFTLQYLAINTLNKDKLENEENSKKIAEETTNQMLERIVELNPNMTEEQLEEMIKNRLLVVKYKNQATIGEIQKKFKEHIEKYINKVNNL